LILTAKKNRNTGDALDIAMASHRIKIRLCLIHHPERRDLALP
jgi:endonuclease YncB( thermonuclease family)